MNITTTHNEIGYEVNLDVIEQGLREHFGLDDNSYVFRAVAAHIWGAMCVQSRGIASARGYRACLGALCRMKRKVYKVTYGRGGVTTCNGVRELGNLIAHVVASDTMGKTFTVEQVDAPKRRKI